MGESRDFPATEMPGKEQDSFGLRESTFKVLEAVVDHNLFNILAIVFRKQANFGKLPAQRGENAPQSTSAPGAALLRIGEREIPHADVAQTGVQQINGPGESDGRRMRQRTRQGPKELYDQPREG